MQNQVRSDDAVWQKHIKVLLKARQKNAGYRLLTVDAECIATQSSSGGKGRPGQ